MAWTTVDLSQGVVRDDSLLCDLSSAGCIDIRGILPDGGRGALWLVDGVKLRRIDFDPPEQIQTKLQLVPALAHFPPGVLPICVAYMGLACGRIRTFVPNLMEPSLPARVNMQHEVLTLTILIFVNQNYILRFNETRLSIERFSFPVPSGLGVFRDLTGENYPHWDSISVASNHSCAILNSYGCGLFLRYNGYGGHERVRSFGPKNFRSLHPLATDHAGMVYTVNHDGKLYVIDDIDMSIVDLDIVPTARIRELTGFSAASSIPLKCPMTTDGSPGILVLSPAMGLIRIRKLNRCDRWREWEPRPIPTDNIKPDTPVVTARFNNIGYIIVAHKQSIEYIEIPPLPSSSSELSTKRRRTERQ
jgi:hypothetical protein